MVSRTIRPARSTSYTSAFRFAAHQRRPIPRTAETMATLRRPLTGSALKATPEASASIIALHQHGRSARWNRGHPALPAVLEDAFA